VFSTIGSSGIDRGIGETLDGEAQNGVDFDQAATLGYSAKT
jgi:hypothetical protein